MDGQNCLKGRCSMMFDPHRWATLGDLKKHLGDSLGLWGGQWGWFWIYWQLMFLIEHFGTWHDLTYHKHRLITFDYGFLSFLKDVLILNFIGFRKIVDPYQTYLTPLVVECQVAVSLDETKAEGLKPMPHARHVLVGNIYWKILKDSCALKAEILQIL